MPELRGPRSKAEVWSSEETAFSGAVGREAVDTKMPVGIDAVDRGVVDERVTDTGLAEFCAVAVLDW